MRVRSYPRSAASRRPTLWLAAALGCSALPLCAQAPQDLNSGVRPLPHNMRQPGSTQLPPENQNRSMLPPTPPTSAPVAATPSANAVLAPLAATPDGPASRRPHRATVVYAGGQLDVRANDSSLNQILRAISRETGMTITGGVADQRVFGNYGPASTSAVLTTLLDGTGTNMLLRDGDSARPPELILTPQGGGPTPPSPSAVPDESIADAPPPPPVAPPPSPVPAQPQPASTAAVPAQTVPATQPAAAAVPINPALPVGNPIPPNNVNGSQYNTTPTASQLPTTNSVPLDSLAHPTTTPAVSGIVDSPNPPAGATPAPGTAPAPASGALTPEMVMQQLLQMQKKQAQPQPAQQPASTTTTPPQ